MFDKATRMKLRFSSINGLLSVEDLWDLPVQTDRAGRESLDRIYKDLSREIKSSEEESLIPTASSVKNEALQLKYDIVKHIAGIKLQEAEDKATAAKKKAEKEKIMEIISNKKDKALEESSLEDLEARLAAL